MNRRVRSALISLVVLFAILWFASRTLMSKPSHAAPNIQYYSQLISAVKAGTPKFELVVFNPSKRSITATETNGKTTVNVHYPSDPAALEFQNLLERKGINFD